MPFGYNGASIECTLEIASLLNLGHPNKLSVIRSSAQGYLLDGGEDGAVLLPTKEASKSYAAGDELDVFVYHDQDGYYLASEKMAIANVGEVAELSVVSVTDFGAFLDWGLSRDLFLPFSESRKFKPVQGRKMVVYIYVDNQGRICASARLDRFLSTETEGFKAGREVDITVCQKTDLGYKVSVNNQYWGLIHNSMTFKSLRIGYKTKGFVKRVREDSRLDIQLEPLGYKRIEPLQQKLLEHIEAAGGFTPLCDKSDPQEIARIFGVSKKAFKQAIGGLLKQGKITTSAQGTRIVD